MLLFWQVANKKLSSSYEWMKNSVEMFCEESTLSLHGGSMYTRKVICSAWAALVFDRPLQRCKFPEILEMDAGFLHSFNKKLRKDVAAAVILTTLYPLSNSVGLNQKLAKYVQDGIVSVCMPEIHSFIDSIADDVFPPNCFAKISFASMAKKHVACNHMVYKCMVMFLFSPSPPSAFHTILIFA